MWRLFSSPHFLMSLSTALCRKTWGGLYCFVLRRLVARARHYQSGRGVPPELGVAFPAELLPMDAAQGQAWLNGDYSLAGAIVRHPQKNMFQIPPPNAEWAASLHSFSWLANIMALGTQPATQYSADSLLQWVRRFSLRHKSAARPEVVARRLLYWSSFLPLLAPHMSVEGQNRIFFAMRQDARYLARTALLADNGLPRLMALAGLAYSAFALADGADRLQRAMRLLARELKRQILEDGGHVSRAPDALLLILPILIALNDELTTRQLPIPHEIADNIKKIADLLAFFRHGDGQLAVFNGGTENSKTYLKTLLARAGIKRQKPFIYSRASAYHRLQAGKSLLFLDIGAPVMGAYGSTTHAAPLAFEFSRAAHRLIVNCGPNLVHGQKWRQASRIPAAHSTCSFIKPHAEAKSFDGFARKLLGARLMTKNIHVSARRIEDKSGIWLETHHNFYARATDMTHHRRLYMSRTGEDIRGEDMLLPLDKYKVPKQMEYALRFHLHPKVKVSAAADGQTILLLLGNGEGWRFRIIKQPHAHLSIGESVYMGERGIPRQSRQIVVNGICGADGISLKWGLKLMT